MASRMRFSTNSRIQQSGHTRLDSGDGDKIGLAQAVARRSHETRDRSGGGYFPQLLVGDSLSTPAQCYPLADDPRVNGGAKSGH